MNNIKLPSAVFAIALIAQNFALAEEYIDTAVVVKTEPVVERLYAPSRNCRHSAYSDLHNRPAHDVNGEGAILGAILGGAVGSQFGKGSGQDAAAALGAVIGTHIGSGQQQMTGEQMLGALAGGVIGNQVGDGSGRTAATATGAALGAALAGGYLSRDRNTIARECGTDIVSRRVITKYKVEYEYNGLVLEGELPYRPEDTIDVIVKVDVLEDVTLERYPHQQR